MPATAACPATAPGPATDRRTPRGLVALAGAGVVAVGVMAFAPQVGALDPRSGYDDVIAPGTDGTAHYRSPETSRAVDVQLVALDPATTVPGGGAVPQGRDVVAVHLRMAAERASDLPGCTVTLGGAQGAVDASVVAVPGTGCGTGPATGRPQHELRSTTYLAVPHGARITQVRVAWAPPAVVELPAV